jgi:hypothetical protein
MFVLQARILVKTHCGMIGRIHKKTAGGVNFFDAGRRSLFRYVLLNVS